MGSGANQNFSACIFKDNVNKKNRLRCRYLLDLGIIILLIINQSIHCYTACQLKKLVRLLIEGGRKLPAGAVYPAAAAVSAGGFYAGRL